MDADVLVVGAGIAGLLAAARLEEYGIGVEIAERAPTLRTTTAGIVLHPNALGCLGRLGPRLAAQGTWIERQVSVDANGSRTLVEWRDVWGAHGLPLAVHRRILAELLAGSVRPRTVMWSAVPRELTQEGGGVTVSFADGDSRRYRLVVGADGVGSWVRRAVDAGAETRFSGHTFVRTTIPALEPVKFREWRLWRAGRFFFGAMPIGLARTAIFLQISEAEPVKIAAEDGYQVLRGAARQMPGEVSSIVTAMRVDERFVARPVYWSSAARQVRGRVALIGDAARSFSPATTQGGGMAAEDAAVLAEEIARHGCAPEALASFERRRRARVAKFIRMARLHVALMDAMQVRNSARLAEPGLAEPGRTTEASRWYRKLYEPLLEAP
jgi:2-polyprenyl-6-methoxyphenol hydroxylase-like FAD-dependent oxidoreductase